MLSELLKKFIENSSSPKEQGDYFEKLIILYLKNEPKFKELFEDVMPYSKWASLRQLNSNDAGIDLVATTQNPNENIAIQCKFYNENYTIQKSDIDSFFTASGKKYFSHRILVATTNKFSKNAEESLDDQSIPVQKIDLYELENSVIDWSEFFKKQEVKIKTKKQPRLHQENAINDVEEGFKNANRGKLIMACGTGKTFTSLKIAEKIVGKKGKVLFLVQSLSLLSQSLTEWTQ